MAPRHALRDAGILLALKLGCCLLSVEYHTLCVAGLGLRSAAFAVQLPLRSLTKLV